MGVYQSTGDPLSLHLGDDPANLTEIPIDEAKFLRASGRVSVPREEEAVYSPGPRAPSSGVELRNPCTANFSVQVVSKDVDSETPLFCNNGMGGNVVKHMLVEGP